MPLHIGDQIAYTFAPMIASDFIMQIAEAALDGIRAGTIRREKQQLKTGLLPEPSLNGCRLVDFTVICYYIDPVKAPGRVGTLQDFVAKFQEGSKGSE
jgi:hypothetical protein